MLLPPPHPADLVPTASDKADGSTFDPDNLVSDTLFRDVGYLNADEVQAMLETTPYATRSALADISVQGASAAEFIVSTARDYGVNPLVLLTKLQVEFSLIYEEDPSSFQLDFAMGCGCHDGIAHCEGATRGLGPQLVCAAAVLNAHYTRADEGEATVSGWEVGRAKSAEDGVMVTPANAATAALYTYTPWVLTGRGGNWLFWNVFRKFNRHINRLTPNRRWIGGLCTEDDACPYLQGICYDDGVEESFCTRPCDLYCPDSDAAFTATTFCVDLGLHEGDEALGHCLSRCDETLFGENDGCAEGFTCVEAARFRTETVKTVCWPNGLARPQP